MNHHCHARNCKTPVKPELFMCFKHWKMISKKTQRLVWLYYRPGQCDDKQPSKEWLNAANLAIEEVIQKEKKQNEKV
jgi:hypothetical protein